MLKVLITRKIKEERQENTFGGDGFVYGIDCGDGAYLSPTSASVWVKYIQLFVCQSSLNKVVLSFWHTEETPFMVAAGIRIRTRMALLGILNMHVF